MIGGPSPWPLIVYQIFTPSPTSRVSASAEAASAGSASAKKGDQGDSLHRVSIVSRLHGAFFGVLRSAPELLQRGAPAQAAVAEQEVPELEEPHAAPHLRVPAHAMAQPPVGLEERPPDRLGPELHEGFDRLHPQDHAPRWQVAGGEDLVLVVPAPHVVLDHAPRGGQSKVGRPAVRRDVERLDLVGIVGEQLPESAPETAVVVLLKTRHPRRHRKDAVLTHQADGLAIYRRRAPLRIAFSVSSSVFSSPAESERSRPCGTAGAGPRRGRCRPRASIR